MHNEQQTKQTATNGKTGKMPYVWRDRFSHRCIQSSTQYTFDNRNRFLDWKTVRVPELIRIHGEY